MLNLRLVFCFLLILAFLTALPLVALSETEEDFIKLKQAEESSVMIPKDIRKKSGSDIISKDVIIEQLSQPQPPGQASSVTFSSDLVLFDFGSARLKEDCYPQLAQIVLAINDPKLAGIPFFYVDGHTCAIGSEENNCRLSWRRAESVVDFLKKSGVPSHKLVARGFGEFSAVAPNDNETGRKTNRRVVLKSGASIAPSDQSLQCPKPI